MRAFHSLPFLSLPFPFLSFPFLSFLCFIQKKQNHTRIFPPLLSHGDKYKLCHLCSYDTHAPLLWPSLLELINKLDDLFLVLHSQRPSLHDASLARDQDTSNLLLSGIRVLNTLSEKTKGQRDAAAGDGPEHDPVLARRLVLEQTQDADALGLPGARLGFVRGLDKLRGLGFALEEEFVVGGFFFCQRSEVALLDILLFVGRFVLGASRIFLARSFGVGGDGGGCTAGRSRTKDGRRV